MCTFNFKMKPLRTIILFGFSTCLTLLVAELYVKTAEIASFSNFEVDPVQGKVLRPNLKLNYFNEGFYMGGVNEHGYLGPAYPVKKEKESIRIALLGDSHIEGFQLFARHHLRSVLEHNLAELTSRNVEVLNFGRSGFNLLDMYRYKIDFVEKYNPDYCLYFIGLDDLMASSHQSLMPSLYLENDSLKISRGFSENRAFRFYKQTVLFRNNSVLLRVFDNCLNLISGGQALKIILGKFYSSVRPPAENFTEQSGLTLDDLVKTTQAVLRQIAQNPNSLLVMKRKLPPELHRDMLGIDLKLVDLEHILLALSNKGIRPRYWKATGKIGHWNHSAHWHIGDLIAKILAAHIQRDSELEESYRGIALGTSTWTEWE